MIQQYYNKHAKEFILNTLNVDLEPIYEKFEKHLKPGQKILDIGFGSGRDSLHFCKKGFQVVSADFSEEIVARGKILLNNEVLLVDIRDIMYKNEFNAVWASAIFLHLNEEDILKALLKVREALKDQGKVYLSFKYGSNEVHRHGRYFNDFTEEKFEKLMEKIDGFTIKDMWKTEDARPDHLDHYWLNIIIEKC